MVTVIRRSRSWRSPSLPPGTSAQTEFGDLVLPPDHAAAVSSGPGGSPAIIERIKERALGVWGVELDDDEARQFIGYWERAVDDQKLTGRKKPSLTIEEFVDVFLGLQEVGGSTAVAATITGAGDPLLTIGQYALDRLNRRLSVHDAAMLLVEWKRRVEDGFSGALADHVHERLSDPTW